MLWWKLVGGWRNCNRQKIPNEPIIFAGFVGAGLVGPLSIGHMIAEMDMKEIAYVRSKHIPPSTVFTSGRLRYPFEYMLMMQERYAV